MKTAGSGRVPAGDAACRPGPTRRHARLGPQEAVVGPAGLGLRLSQVSSSRVSDPGKNITDPDPT